jgi:uncharacterized protein (DUF2252 family)
MTTESESAPPKVPHLTVEQRESVGRVARETSPRTSHSTLEPTKTRDAVALLEEQGPARLQELLPIRYGRMLVSPFTFYRGAANVMANDLAPVPRSGLNVQLCGDAHLSNFGGFASPERSFVFDLNDFDETLAGPFEWDVKRLTTSFEVAGRDRGFSDLERRTAVLAVARAYRESMRSFAAMTNLDIWYSRLDSAALEAAIRERRGVKEAKIMARTEAKARTKDSVKAFSRLTEVIDGERRIVSDPPLVIPLRDLAHGLDARGLEEELQVLLRTYRHSLQGDRRHLLEGYHYVDLAHKVVGVGSVGTRCWIVLLLGRDDGDPLFLQVKEAGPSVLEPLLGKSGYANHGQRIVEGQRLMQASSDIFLGWIRNERTLDETTSRDFYVRQLWDWKASVDLDIIKPVGLELYARACGWTLARAHARSGDRIAISAYLGKSDVFDRAVADFATAYADLNERDYEALAVAAREGRVVAREGL